jgi:hypothetical protein
MMHSLMSPLGSLRGIGLVLALFTSLLFTGCASSVKLDSNVVHAPLQVEGVSRVELSLSPEASKQLGDNKKFDPEQFSGYLSRKFDSKGLLNEASLYQTEVIITDLRLRSSFSAVVFGILAGSDYITGNVRLIDPKGRVVRTFEVSASYLLGGVAGFDGIRIDWLYDRFAELALVEISKDVLAVRSQGLPVVASNVVAAPNRNEASRPNETTAMAIAAAPAVRATNPISASSNVPVAQDSSVANMAALLADASAIPMVSERCRAIYKEDWLAREKPRAFVVEKSGRCFGAWGNVPSNSAEASDPLERAMRRCKAARLKACVVYAQDDQVVYQAAR